MSAAVAAASASASATVASTVRARRTPARARLSPVFASCGDKGEADRARARRIQRGLAEFAEQEKAYAKAQYRWLARQHARAQSALKKAVHELKAEWQEEPAVDDDRDLWKYDDEYGDHHHDTDHHHDHDDKEGKKGGAAKTSAHNKPK